jgi:hypothetical protein
MQRPISMKKKSRQEENVRQTRLYSQATFVQDAIPQCLGTLAGQIFTLVFGELADGARWMFHWLVCQVSPVS